MPEVKIGEESLYLTGDGVSQSYIWASNQGTWHSRRALPPVLSLPEFSGLQAATKVFSMGVSGYPIGVIPPRSAWDPTGSHRLRQEIIVIRSGPVQRTRGFDRTVPALVAPWRPCLPSHGRSDRPIPQQYRYFPLLLHTRGPLPVSDPQSASHAIRRPKHDRARGLGEMVEARHLPLRPSPQSCSTCSTKGMKPIEYLLAHHGGSLHPSRPFRSRCAGLRRRPGYRVSWLRRLP